MDDERNCRWCLWIGLAGWLFEVVSPSVNQSVSHSVLAGWQALLGIIVVGADGVIEMRDCDDVFEGRDD